MNFTRELINSLENFKNKRAIVLGDIMLDQYLYGEVNRISQEAPVPIVHFLEEKYTLGGAGNLAANLVGLGARVFLTGTVGNDEKGKIILQLIKNLGMSTEGIFGDKTKPTIVKQRIVVNKRQLLRVDYEDTNIIKKFLAKKIISFIKEKLNKVDVIAIGDYAKGLIDKSLAGKLINLANSRKIPVVVDTKPKNFDYFAGATLIKLNLKEAKEAARLNEEASIEEIGKALVSRSGSNIFITQGEKGITVFEKNGKITHFSAKKAIPIDITGAGDTVCAICALGIASNFSLSQIAELANVGGKIVVEKPGTAPLSLNELKEALMITQPNLLRKKVRKKWGYEDWIVNYEGANFCGKRLVIKRGYQCSIHYHKEKCEVFYVNKGFVLMQAYDKEILMKAGDSLLIEPGTKHRFIGLTNAEIIEFSSYHKEEDSFRLEPSGKVDKKTFEKYLRKYLKNRKKISDVET